MWITVESPGGVRTFSPQRILWRTTTYPQAIAGIGEQDFCSQKILPHSTGGVNNFPPPGKEFPQVLFWCMENIVMP